MCARAFVRASVRALPGCVTQARAFSDWGAQGQTWNRLNRYLNNCICRERYTGSPNSDAVRAVMEKSAAAAASYGFDEVKLDGCGELLNLTWWHALFNNSGRPIMVENCHWYPHACPSRP